MYKKRHQRVEVTGPSSSHNGQEPKYAFLECHSCSVNNEKGLPVLLTHLLVLWGPGKVSPTPSPITRDYVQIHRPHKLQNAQPVTLPSTFRSGRKNGIIHTSIQAP